MTSPADHRFEQSPMCARCGCDHESHRPVMHCCGVLMGEPHLRVLPTHPFHPASEFARARFTGCASTLFDNDDRGHLCGLPWWDPVHEGRSDA